MKYIYLNSKYDEFTIDEDTYEQIAALVQASKHCTHDYHNVHGYTLDNPCVGKGICLQHLLERQNYLAILDSPETNSDGQHFYRFMDKQGIVYTATEDVSTEASKNTAETLAYYGFTPPLKVVSRGKSVDFYTHYASLYGDLKTASVIVLAYNQYSDKVKGLFLLYKNAPPKELSRKNDLYHNADALVEASKTPQGEYTINGHTHFNKYEADVFEVISQLESAVYDVTRRLQNGKQVEENHTGESGD